MGDSGAYCNLGNMYDEGLGVNQDYKKAVEYYQKACDLGDSGAYCNLGVMYSSGLGVAVDKNKALQLYKKSCDMGNEQGCRNYRILKNQMGL